MRKQYLLNKIIDLLLEHRVPVHYVSSNPVTFYFEYFGYEFYLIWDIEDCMSEDVRLVYRAYLHQLNYSINGIILYIDHIREKDNHFEIRLTEDYLAYIDHLSLPPDFFTFEMLVDELEHFKMILSCMEIDMIEIIQSLEGTAVENAKRILEHFNSKDINNNPNDCNFPF